jgi:hypothetical protein
MSAGTYCFTIEQGATFNTQLTWFTDDTQETAVNLTGFTAKMQVRARLDDVTVLLELSTANGKITLGGVAGTILLHIDAADTALLTFEKGVYDLELTNGSGVVTRLLQGVINMQLEVTRTEIV